eukprot:g1666.t1
MRQKAARALMSDEKKEEDPGEEKEDKKSRDAALEQAQAARAAALPADYLAATSHIPTSFFNNAAAALLGLDKDKEKEEKSGEARDKGSNETKASMPLSGIKPEEPKSSLPALFGGKGGMPPGPPMPMGRGGGMPGMPPMPMTGAAKSAGMMGMKMDGPPKMIPPKFGGPCGVPGPMGCGGPPPIPVKSGAPNPSAMALIPAKSASMNAPKDDDDDDSDDDSSDDEEGAAPNPMMMLMMLKQMQSSVMQNMSKAPPEMQDRPAERPRVAERRRMVRDGRSCGEDAKSSLPAALANKQKMDASSNLLNVASTASSTAMPNMGLPAAQAMAAAGASPEMLQMMQQMGMGSGGYAARELQAAQEAAQAQQAALEAMSPEQREAVLAAMSAASEAQQAQQSQFYEAMKAHEMEKLQKSGYYQSNQPERFKDGYRPLRMCKHFKTDQCWRGQECTYAHSLEELHPASPDLPRDCVLGRACPYAHGEKELGTVELVVCGRVKTRICKFWTTGNCMFLGNCVNAHGEKELGTKRPDFMTPPMKKRREGESIDHPLDSPEQPAEYLHQTRGKLEAAILAAVQVLQAEVIVVADVGCGVFGNDPFVIGGCLGSVLRRFASLLSGVKQVIITGRRGDFGDACERAMKGEENDGVIRGGLKRPQKSSQYGLCLLWS